MTEQLVPTVSTPLTMASFAKACVAVWPEATKEGAGVLWAQFAAETGDGKHCYGWNLGNVKYTKGCGLNYQALRGVFEFINGKRIEVPASDPSAWFRVYESLEHGMSVFVTSKRTGRWATAWPFLMQGNCDAYARELHRLKYFTASPDSYANLMKAKHKVWMASSAFDDALSDARQTDPAPEPREDFNPANTSDWVPISHDGVEWLVSPVYIAPVGIGEAEYIASANGCELPTPELVDAIWRAADLKLSPLPRTPISKPPNDGTPKGMSSPEVYADQAARIYAQYRDHDFRLIAGTHKDVVVKDGKVGLYGWHYPDGRVIQPFFGGHSRAWRDYSQGLRLCRRVKT